MQNSNMNVEESSSAESKIVVAPKQVKVCRPSQRLIRGVPPEIENDPILKEMIQELPSNYNFEIPKIVWKIREKKAKTVALQLPEGLQIFTNVLSGIFFEYCGVLCISMSDVTYGACCVDDISAASLGADILVHYGHSCLVPVDKTTIPVIYVFVDIKFDSVHLFETVKATFEKKTPLALVSIVQFVGSLQSLAASLKEEGYDVLVPKSRPLSPGEVLGCTSPALPKVPKYTIIALGDGRFHLESIMISNPELDTYLYNPYNKVLSREFYDQPLMKRTRKNAIETASTAQNWGMVFSTLGRQGSPKVFTNIKKSLVEAGKSVIEVAHDQLYPDLLNTMDSDVDCWIQVACPRLSIDWGQFFSKPLLTPYEANVALKLAQWHPTSYPMDYYANDSLGDWTPNYVAPCACGKTRDTGCKGRKCQPC